MVALFIVESRATVPSSELASNVAVSAVPGADDPPEPHVAVDDAAQLAVLDAVHNPPDAQAGPPNVPAPNVDPASSMCVVSSTALIENVPLHPVTPVMPTTVTEVPTRRPPPTMAGDIVSLH